MLFRSSPMLDLRRLDELPPEQSGPFRELERDADFYGLLVPRPGTTLNLKSVGREVAELFRTLQTPAAIEADDDVIDLVLDGVLEIESAAAFVSGADALSIVVPVTDAAEATHSVARISRDALLYAQDLDSDDPQVLTPAIYFYNRIPITPFWRSRFPNRDAVAAHLGIETGSLRVVLDQHWIPVPAERANGWLSWYSRTARARDAEAVTHKLYVSPRPEHIREAFEAVVRVLADFPGAQMKIGQDAGGLLRPDKLVTYFHTREELDEAADALRRQLAGCPAHGVPFTAGIDEEGLLSWGIDPPESEQTLSWLGRESWRLWLAQRMGAAMAIAKRARGNAVEPWRFVVERVRRQGVDVDTWTPAASLWRNR
jgi:hypothetical protein